MRMTASATGTRVMLWVEPEAPSRKSDRAADLGLQFLGGQAVKARRTDIFAAPRADRVRRMVEEQGPRLAGRVAKIEDGKLRIKGSGRNPVRPGFARRVQPGDIAVFQFEPAVGADRPLLAECKIKGRLACLSRRFAS